MTIQQKLIKKKVAKRRPTRKLSTKRKNSNHKAFEMGYEVGKHEKTS